VLLASMTADEFAERIFFGWHGAVG
jgi:hypothetical protein